MLNLFLCSTLFTYPYQISIRVPIMSMYLQAEGKNDVDIEQLASKKPAYLDLHCFQNRIYRSSAWPRLNSRLISTVYIKVVYFKN